MPAKVRFIRSFVVSLSIYLLSIFSGYSAYAFVKIKKLEDYVEYLIVELSKYEQVEERSMELASYDD